ncbi:MAG: undecaprenyl diphosphate synthase family protein, partial [Egibacteraceae bacterium]
MSVRDLVYSLYERRLLGQLEGAERPRHVGVILDGNRRWARATGAGGPSSGHRRGADHITNLLGWCDQAGVQIVTLWLLSTDNLARPAAELEPLLAIIESTVEGLAASNRPWRVHPMGSLDLLPGDTAQVLKEAAEGTNDRPGVHVNIAVAYGGRREIADAVR